MAWGASFMLFVDNKVDLFIMDGFLEVGDDYFGEFFDNVRGDVGEKVLNGSVGSVRRSLIEVREEFVNIFSGLFSLVDGVRGIFVLDCGDLRGFGSLFVG